MSSDPLGEFRYGLKGRRISHTEIFTIWKSCTYDTISHALSNWFEQLVHQSRSPIHPSAVDADSEQWQRYVSLNLIKKSKFPPFSPFSVIHRQRYRFQSSIITVCKYSCCPESRPWGRWNLLRGETWIAALQSASEIKANGPMRPDTHQKTKKWFRKRLFERNWPHSAAPHLTTNK